VYSQFLKERMDQDAAKREAEAAEKAKKKPKSSAQAKGKKRTRIVVETDESDAESSTSKRKKGATGKPEPVTEQTEPRAFTQPALITGAKLKPYQLDGLQWMVSLDQNGISGILGV
jgi:ATP-dependent DNA helicase